MTMSNLPSPVFTPANLVGNSPSMSADHRVLSITSPKYKIGRSLEVDLCLMDVNISRLHCVFSFCDDAEWSVTDHSSNGVWVGGVRTKKGVPTKLKQGDTVVLSELTKLYSWKFGLGLMDKEEEEPVAKRRKVVVE